MKRILNTNFAGLRRYRLWLSIRICIFVLCLICSPVPIWSQTQPTLSFSKFDIGMPQPVLKRGVPGAWDENIREKVSVVYESGMYRMWYVGHSSVGQIASKVGYATSENGVDWIKHPGNPIIDRSSQDQDICVVKTHANTYHMYVEVNDSYIDLFFSDDSVHWTPYPGNPIKTVASSPVVWREDSQWFMLYEYMSGTIFNIHLAKSTDGIIWTDSPGNPVLTSSSATVPDSVIREGSLYHLYYHQNDSSGSPSWHATSLDLIHWDQRERINSRMSSPSAFLDPSGQVWCYFWNLAGDGNYYLRYGMNPGSPSIWRFDENSGTTTGDSSGNLAQGVLEGGAFWTGGLIGSAIDFDGINDAVRTGFFVDHASWTVAVWVKSPSAPVAALASGPVNRNANFQINWNHPNAAFRGAVALRVGGVWYAARFGTLLPDQWYHLAATYDGETLCAYKDGVLITANQSPSGPPNIESAALMFGRHATAAQYFQGTIDAVRVYSRALNDIEIRYLAQGLP